MLVEAYTEHGIIIKVTERYAQLSTATLQDAANSASDYLDKALEKTSE